MTQTIEEALLGLSQAFKVLEKKTGAKITATVQAGRIKVSTGRGFKLDVRDLYRHPTQEVDVQSAFYGEEDK